VAFSRAAEVIGAMVFLTMFCAFVLQVFSRYVLNSPLGWTSELSTISYLWMTFWGGGLLARRQDQVRFDLLYQRLSSSRQRILGILGSAILLFIFIYAFPSNYDFIRFMGYDRTWVLGLRFDWVFSVFLVFIAGMVASTASRTFRLLRKDWRRWL